MLDYISSRMIVDYKS